MSVWEEEQMGTGTEDIFMMVRELEALGSVLMSTGAVTLLDEEGERAGCWINTDGPTICWTGDIGVSTTNRGK